MTLRVLGTATALLAASSAAAGQAGSPERTVASELEQSGLLARFGLPADGAGSGEPSLESCLVLALGQNQMLQSQYADYLAAHESIAVAGSLPDPRFCTSNTCNRWKRGSVPRKGP